MIIETLHSPQGSSVFVSSLKSRDTLSSTLAQLSNEHRELQFEVDETMKAIIGKKGMKKKKRSLVYATRYYTSQ